MYMVVHSYISRNAELFLFASYTPDYLHWHNPFKEKQLKSLQQQNDTGYASFTKSFMLQRKV